MTATETTTLMTEFQIKIALFEYDNVIVNINHTKLFGYEQQIYCYENFAKSAKPNKTFKLNVMFQTDFLEETYRDFLFNKRPIVDTKKKINKWRHELIKNNPKSIDWDSIIFSSEPDNLQEILTLHSDRMTDEVYWKTIAHCYTNSNLGHSKNDVISFYLQGNRPNRHFLMEEDERKFLIELPEQITIYRGCSKKEIKNNKHRYSWTLDKKIAEYFAFEYVNLSLNQPVEKDKSNFDVVEKTINKSEVIAYFNGRKESEILYFPKK